MTTTITTVLAIAFALVSLASFAGAAVGGWLGHSETDDAILLLGGCMFGWAACAMLFGVGVGS